MKNKSFIITVDTEGDNLWSWCDGKEITTRNAFYISRFQELCEKYGFKPTYLTNYEMALEDRWVEYGKQKAKLGLCEIGMHIHAWNSPPLYNLDRVYSGNPYITEYPEHIINAKVQYIVELLERKFEVKILSSRSGRWATNDEYFAALKRTGIKIDCSVTPEMNLSSISGCSQNIGNDYSKCNKCSYEIYPGIIEVPMTTRHINWFANGSIRHGLKAFVVGEDMWLRPHKKSLRYLQTLTHSVEKEECDYLEFMLHSSELMPGGSPYFKNSQDVENLYDLLESYFSIIKAKGYTGDTLTEYYRKRFDDGDY